MRLASVWPSRWKSGTSEEPIADTKCGPVQGFSMLTDRGAVNVFLGIPYAEPPVGELRFEVNFCNHFFLLNVVNCFLKL